MNTENTNDNQAAEAQKSTTASTKPGKPKPALNFLLMGAGSVFTSMVVAGFLVGYVFDELFDTAPLFILVCGVMGFIGGTMKVHKLLNKMDLMYEPASESKENKAVDK